MEVNDQEENPRDEPSRAIQLYILFLLSWQKLFRVSNVGMNVLLSTISQPHSQLTENKAVASVLLHASKKFIFSPSSAR